MFNFYEIFHAVEIFSGNSWFNFLNLLISNNSLVKKLFFIFFFLLYIVSYKFSNRLIAQAPTLEWAKKIGGGQADVTRSMAIDTFGNIYTTGRFSGTVDFDPSIGVFELTAIGIQDAYILMLDSSGNFISVIRYGGQNTIVNGRSILIDSSGNIYVTGDLYDGEADFDPGAGVYSLNASGAIDFYILKLDSLGNFLWAENIGGDNIELSIKLFLDADNNLYTIGYFRDQVDFDPGIGTFNLTSEGSNFDIFILKLNTDGGFIWAKRMGSTGIDLGISANSGILGDVYSTGWFEGTVDFDPNTGIYDLTAAGSNDVFISKLGEDGNFICAKQLGGSGLDNGWSLALDDVDNIYIAGNFSGTADFDPGIAFFNLTSNGGSNVFVSKLDSAGNFIWAKNFSGNFNDESRTVVLDEIGNVYCTGKFSGTVDFDPGFDVFNLISYGSDDVFIVKLDTDGNFIWALQMGGSSSEIGNSIALDNLGNIYTSGDFQGTVDFDPSGDVFDLSSFGDYDVFVHKLRQTVPTIYGTDLNCFGDSSGVAWVVPYFGTPPYTFQWAPISSINDTLFNLGIGWYTVEITDSLGVQITDSIFINQPNALAVEIDLPFDSVCRGNSIFATAIGSGGNLPYNYLWTSGINNAEQNIEATLDSSGYISVFLTDFKNCISTDSIFVFIQTPPMILSSSDTCICSGSAANISASGTPTYYWNTGDTAASITVTPIESTYYFVSYSDGICSVVDTTLVCVFPPVVVDAFVVDPISCFGENDGSASVSFTGGIPPYSISWLPNGEVNDSIFNLPAGTYTVVLFDSICGGFTDNIILIEPDVLEVDIAAADDSICNGSTLSFDAIANGGTIPYNYLWSSGESNDNINLIVEFSSFVYVNIVDGNNCAVDDSVFITVINPLLIQSTADTCICEGDTVNLYASGTPSYYWSTGDTTFTILVSPTTTTSYIVSYIDGICNADDTTVICVNPNPGFVVSADTSVAHNASVILQTIGDGIFYWTPANSLSCNPCPNPIASPENNTLYIVTVTNEFGCTSIDSINVEVYYYQITIPNVITPNGDEMNDTFEIVGLPVNSAITIYNRWGNELLSTSSYKNDWENPVDGVYFYLLNTPDGKFYNGSFQVKGN